VKLLRVENDRHIFELAKREKDLLAITLGFYPVMPSAHQRLSKSSQPEDASQCLLDESLAEQRKENKKFARDLFSNPQRFRETEDAVEMTLSAAEIEWLLQVLNDVQVGNWILLGSPEKRPRFSPHSENARHVLAMDLACMFQSELLEAIHPNS
jgi:hypothetical protein